MGLTLTFSKYLNEIKLPKHVRAADFRFILLDHITLHCFCAALERVGVKLCFGSFYDLTLRVVGLYVGIQHYILIVCI